MNKYSKRALKTTATVGMSLAMVLSGVAAPAMKINAATVCDATAIAKIPAATTYIKGIQDALDIESVNYLDATELAVSGALDNLKAMVACPGIASEEYTKIAEKLVAVFGAKDENETYDYELAVMELINLVAEKSDVITFKYATSDKLADATVAPGTLTFALQTTEPEDSKITMADDGTLVKTGFANKAAYTDAVTLSETLAGDFKGNIDVSLQAVVEKYLPVLDDYITAYKEDNIDVALKDYVDSLKDAPLAGKTVANVIDEKVEVQYTNAKAISTFITKVETDKAGLTGKYADFSDEADVIEIMETLEAVVDGMNEVADFAKSYKTDDAFTKYTSTIDGKLEELNKISADDIVEKLSTEFISGSVKALTTDEIKKVVAFVEDIYGEFYEITKTERTNGTYRIQAVGTDNARFLGTTIKNAVKKTNLETFLMKLVDKEEEDTYYDVAVDLVKNVDDAIKDITTGIKGITTSNLSASNVNKVIAADKAYGVLTGNTISSYYTGSANGWEDIPELGAGTETGYKFNLTSAQAKSVKGQVATLKNLVAKMYALGLEDTELKTGWVDLGNGNWDFFNEDGSVATKWVAAGKDWYYVKASHMLRNAWIAENASGARWYYVNDKGVMVTNTVVDGYTIDANGIWTK